MMDYTTDKNPTYIYKALEALDGKLPESLNDAEIPSRESVEGLSKHAFADQKNKLFPCYDELTTFLSACNVYGTGVEDSEIIDVIEKRASFLKIDSLISELKEVFTGHIEKSASESAGENFALVIDEDGVETGFLPLNDILDLDHSCHEWKDARMHAKLPSDLLKEAATKIVDAAERFNAIESVPSIIKEAAEERLMDLSLIPSQIAFRVNSVQDPEAKELYIKMACDLSEDTVAEWVEVLDLMDHAILTPEIRRHDMFKTAAETIYSGIPIKELEKIASTHISIAINNESILLPKDELNKFSDEDLFKFYPKSTAELLKQAKDSSNTAEASAIFEKIDDTDKIDFLSDLKDRV
jgi:hypothetical protein